MRKIFATLLVAVLALSGCVFKSRAPVNLQPQKTGIATIRFHDDNRERLLITEVWYPIDAHVNAIPVKGLWVRCPEAREAPISKASEKYPLILDVARKWRRPNE